MTYTLEFAQKINAWFFSILNAERRNRITYDTSIGRG